MYKGLFVFLYVEKVSSLINYMMQSILEVSFVVCFLTKK
jgi:hypothetical protein